MCTTATASRPCAQPKTVTDTTVTVVTTFSVQTVVDKPLSGGKQKKLSLGQEAPGERNSKALKAAPPA